MNLDFIDFDIFSIIDIVLVAALLYYVYKLVRETVAIKILVGILIILIIWKITQVLQMEMLSSILGRFFQVGMFGLIVVFQQEIRKFLLMIGSTNIANRNSLFRQFQFFKQDQASLDHIEVLVKSCKKLSKTNTGGLIVIKRSTNLDFVTNSGDNMDVQINQPIIQSIFYKNSPLHDGAIVIDFDRIIATRVILPVSNSRKIPLRFGLRHRAALGITEKTDALALVISEENGQISYLKDGEFVIFEDLDELTTKLKNDLS
ncbi:MAG: diadenylate cyclase CdaA [Psychroflexus sp.]|jgi:uncharacterized protein (TIGR00159 family)|nr:diadenylate cyclase CdaA [Psychroflexus sp.]MDR9448384.1 diadenylate cyclase CdaA [Psychroflexus sp.]